MNHRLSVLLISLVVVAAGAALLVGFSGNMSADNNCTGQPGQNFHVTVRSDKVSQTKINGKLCDTITFTNQDPVAREIAFGPHEDHVPYDGVAERVLAKNQSFTITLNQAGLYRWHDHLHDEVQGTFVVTN